MSGIAADGAVAGVDCLQPDEGVTSGAERSALDQSTLWVANITAAKIAAVWSPFAGGRVMLPIELPTSDEVAVAAAR